MAENVENTQDEEALAAEWEAAAAEDNVVEEDDENPSGRVLDQDEIDSLLGFDGDDEEGTRHGIQAIMNSALVSYERLPMLDIIFDRVVRLMTTSLRNFTSDNIEVSLDNINSVRSVSYTHLTLPTMYTV